MKTKIAIVLSVLFAAAPIAMPKGAPTGVKFSVSCVAADSCTVIGSGLAPNSSYQLDITDSCGILSYSSAENTNSAGAISITVTAAESTGCNVSGWTFTLSTIGKRSSRVATLFVYDVD
jgi:hypothetical protein